MRTMSKVWLACLAAMLAPSISANAAGTLETTKWQGNDFKAYVVLISSTGVKPAGTAISKSEHFFSSYGIVTENFFDMPVVNDWLLFNYGPYDVWLGSSPKVGTEGATNEGFRLIDDMSISIDGQTAARVYPRIKAALLGWSTGYMITIGDK